MPKKPSHRRIVMARRLAKRWVEANARPEYRLKVYRSAAKELKNLPGLLRSFRDGKLKIAGIEPIEDLGIQPGFDHLIVWSSNRKGLIELDAWFHKSGCETTGVW
jgi:hypothetical protein